MVVVAPKIIRCLLALRICFSQGMLPRGRRSMRTGSVPWIGLPNTLPDPGEIDAAGSSSLHTPLLAVEAPESEPILPPAQMTIDSLLVRRRERARESPSTRDQHSDHEAGDQVDAKYHMPAAGAVREPIEEGYRQLELPPPTAKKQGLKFRIRTEPSRRFTAEDILLFELLKHLEYDGGPKLSTSEKCPICIEESLSAEDPEPAKTTRQAAATHDGLLRETSPEPSSCVVSDDGPAAAGIEAEAEAEAGRGALTSAGIHQKQTSGVPLVPGESTHMQEQDSSGGGSTAAPVSPESASQQNGPSATPARKKKIVSFLCGHCVCSRCARQLVSRLPTQESRSMNEGDLEEFAGPPRPCPVCRQGGPGDQLPTHRIAERFGIAAKFCPLTRSAEKPTVDEIDARFLTPFLEVVGSGEDRGPRKDWTQFQNGDNQDRAPGPAQLFVKENRPLLWKKLVAHMQKERQDWAAHVARLTPASRHARAEPASRAPRSVSTGLLGGAIPINATPAGTTIYNLMHDDPQSYAPRSRLAARGAAWAGAGDIDDLLQDQNSSDQATTSTAPSSGPWTPEDRTPANRDAGIISSARYVRQRTMLDRVLLWGAQATSAWVVQVLLADSTRARESSDAESLFIAQAIMMPPGRGRTALITGLSVRGRDTDPDERALDRTPRPSTILSPEQADVDRARAPASRNQRSSFSRFCRRARRGFNFFSTDSTSFARRAWGRCCFYPCGWLDSLDRFYERYPLVSQRIVLPACFDMCLCGCDVVACVTPFPTSCANICSTCVICNAFCVCGPRRWLFGDPFRRRRGGQPASSSSTSTRGEDTSMLSGVRELFGVGFRVGSAYMVQDHRLFLLDLEGTARSVESTSGIEYYPELSTDNTRPSHDAARAVGSTLDVGAEEVLSREDYIDFILNENFNLNGSTTSTTAAQQASTRGMEDRGRREVSYSSSSSSGGEVRSGDGPAAATAAAEALAAPPAQHEMLAAFPRDAGAQVRILGLTDTSASGFSGARATDSGSSSSSGERQQGGASPQQEPAVPAARTATPSLAGLGALLGTSLTAPGASMPTAPSASAAAAPVIFGDTGNAGRSGNGAASAAGAPAASSPSSLSPGGAEAPTLQSQGSSETLQAQELLERIDEHESRDGNIDIFPSAQEVEEAARRTALTVVDLVRLRRGRLEMEVGSLLRAIREYNSAGGVGTGTAGTSTASIPGSTPLRRNARPFLLRSPGEDPELRALLVGDDEPVSSGPPAQFDGAVDPAEITPRAPSPTTARGRASTFSFVNEIDRNARSEGLEFAPHLPQSHLDDRDVLDFFLPEPSARRAPGVAAAPDTILRRGQKDFAKAGARLRQALLAHDDADASALVGDEKVYGLLQEYGLADVGRFQADARARNFLQDLKLALCWAAKHRSGKAGAQHKEEGEFCVIHASST